MGSGGGTPPSGASISGAGGGRILPGAASGILSASFAADGNSLFLVYGYPGRGPGEVGTATVPATSTSGAGGGGWGAAGGIGSAGETFDSSDPPGTLSGPNGLGGAGGKAINTNGFSVTFTGGSSRIYGVVG